MLTQFITSLFTFYFPLQVAFESNFSDILLCVKIEADSQHQTPFLLENLRIYELSYRSSETPSCLRTDHLILRHRLQHFNEYLQNNEPCVN